MSIHKNSMKILFILLLTVLVVGCLPKVKKDKSEFVKVVIADRTFKVLRGYFDGRTPSGKDSESVVLEYSLPDFEILPPYTQEYEKRRELISAGLQRTMLLEAERNRPPVHVSASNHLGKDYMRQEGDFYGLEKYVYPVKEGKYKPYIRDDFFLERDNNGQITSHLFCSPPNKDKVPSCNHRFLDKGVIYKIGWPVRELPNWQKQREAAIEFMDALEIKNLK